jgi:hypothetical protein
LDEAVYELLGVFLQHRVNVIKNVVKILNFNLLYRLLPLAT